MIRNIDTITDKQVEMESLYCFRNFPVNMLANNKSILNDDPVYDMNIAISPDTGILQILDLVPETLIYVDTHSNAIGGIWKRQHEVVASLIADHKPHSVLEIGGGTGVLERSYRQIIRNEVASWYIIDPAPNPIDTKAIYIKGFFPQVLPKSLEFDMIVHSHTWEHAFSSRAFISSIANIMAPGKKMIFSVPNLRYLLEHSMTSILNFEHTVYLSDDYIDYLLCEFGFKVESKIFFENHSVIYSTTKIDEKKQKFGGCNLYNHNKRLFKNYIDEHKRKMLIINSTMNSGKKYYLFGAHITSQFYVAFGLDISKICGILDNDIYKHGKRVSGLPWIVQSPILLKDLVNPSVILPSGPYSGEIKKQILEINSNTMFIEVDAV